MIKKRISKSQNDICSNKMNRRTPLMKHRKQGPGHATAQGRRRRYLCLALTLYTPLLTAVVLIVTYTHPIDFSLSEYLLLIWPLSAKWD